MILSDREIRTAIADGTLVIDPFDASMIQPSSIDLHVDAGWSGHLTLELSNVANLPITIYPGMKIGQLCVFQMTSPAERPYSKTGKYQGQRGPTASRFFMDFKASRAARSRATERVGERNGRGARKKLKGGKRIR